MESEEDRFLSYPKRLIECPVCLGTFDQPKVLPCQHTFCLACLDRLRSPDNHVTCPICQRIAVLPPDGGASRLPTNFFLVQLMDVSRPSAAVKDRDEEEKEVYCCDACVYSSSFFASSATSAAVAVAESFCVDCAQNLCRACVNAHSGIRALWHHRLSAIDAAATAKDSGDRRRKQLLFAAANRPIYCVDHPTNEIAFYCRDCSASICVKCGFLRHRNHECADVEDKANESRQEIDRMVEVISHKISDCRSVDQDLNRELSSFDETVEKIRKQITDRAEEVISCVRRQEQDLLKAVKLFEKQFRLSIEILSEKVETKVGNMEAFVQFCRQLRDSGTHNDVITLWPQLMASGEQYRTVHFARTVVAPELMFSPSTAKLDELKTIGDIACESSDDDCISELLKNCRTTISNYCDVEGLSSSCVQNAEPFVTKTSLEDRREGEGVGTVMTASDQQSLKPQNSLTSNDEESEDSTEYNSDQSLDDYATSEENKGFWEDDIAAYGQQQCDSAVVADMSGLAGSDSNDDYDDSGTNNGQKSCNEQQHEEVVSDLMSLQLNIRGGSVEVVDTIPGNDPIAGIAVLLDHLYVLRQSSDVLERYDLRTHRPTAMQPLEYREVRRPTDLAACAASDTLYIGQTNKTVFGLRVARPNATPQRLAVALTYKHLSVTTEASVLMGCLKADTILEYTETPVWTELRRISIPGSHPTSMVQISPNFFVVSSKMNVLYLVGLNGSKVDYRCLSVPHNISHIAADVSGPRLIVANCYGHSILRLDPRASSPGGARSWPIVEPKTVSRPSRLWTDKVGRRLFVGTAHGDVKILSFKA